MLWARDDFERDWRYFERDRFARKPRIEDYLEGWSEALRRMLLRGLLALEINLRYEAGDRPTREEYRQRFPQHIELIDEVFISLPSEADGNPPSNKVVAKTPHAQSISSSLERLPQLLQEGRRRLATSAVTRWSAG
jgi:hypothetical protein